MIGGTGCRLFALLLALASTELSAKSPAVADALTRSLLREAEFEQISISPNGKLLAIARQVDGVSSVTLHKIEDLEPIISFDPGHKGIITELEWIDDGQLIIGATRINGVDGYAAFDPMVMIVRVDGADPFVLPGNFFSTLEDDPDHVLMYTCGFATATAGCRVPEIRRNDLKHLTKRGELVSSGPEDTTLYADDNGNGRLAIKWEDDATSKSYVYDLAKSEWKLLNDGSKSGVEVMPLGVARDGKSGFLESQRKDGPDVVERLDFATGARTVLVADAGSDPLRMISSIDGRTVIGAVYEPTSPKLRFWQPNDADSQLTAELQTAFPGHLALVTSATADGNLAIVSVSSDRDPGAFYLFDRRARKAKILARRKPWIDPAQQGPQRGFELKARDGLELHGLLTLPPNSTGKNLPMVVLPHGGPYEVTEIWGYDSEAQILAQHGYAVLQVNFRGSGGYGRHFTNLGERQWGRAMQDDVTDATRWAIAQGIADSRRICIYGASYGGYAALMGPIRAPDLYRCAIGFAGVFDLSKMYKWGNIRKGEVGQLYLERVLGHDQAELAAHSPARLADQIHVPVLLAHGVRDARVDIKHAQLMARELGKRKQPVELIEYSATGHGLMLERHRLDFYARLVEFLDANTKLQASTDAGAVATGTGSGR